jgi:hypothetical protein
MAAITNEPFRFMDLPGEIRNEIYALLLCSFQEPHTMKDTMNGWGMGFQAISYGPTVARHSIDTAILRTNSEIHREAYDVMVKTNGFIRIDSTAAADFHQTLNMFSVPIVTANTELIEQFQGFTLKLTVAYIGQRMAVEQQGVSVTHDAFMVRAEDAQRLCCAIQSSSFQRNLDIEVAPALRAQPARYRPSFDTYFSEHTQRKILHPFQHLIRGLAKFNIWGKVLPLSLDDAIRREVAQNEWDDPQAAIDYALKVKSDGERALKAGYIQNARRICSIATNDITRMRKGSSWSKLCERGGRSLLNWIAWTQFRIYLNGIDIWLEQRRTSPDASIEKDFEDSIEDLIMFAFELAEDHYWKRDFQWFPPMNDCADLYYREAHHLRLLQNPLRVNEALEAIDDAVDCAPNNEEFKKEQLIILQWHAEGAQHYKL